LLGQARSTQRRVSSASAEENRLTKRIIFLATRYGRYGYRRVTALLSAEGWRVNHKRVERIWRREGLKVPQKQPKRGRLWLNDGSCIRLRPEHKDHVWSYDFVKARTERGGKLRILVIIDEYPRECLAIRVEPSIPASAVIETLEWLFLTRGVAKYIRSDNGPEFIARAVCQWLENSGCQTLFINPGSPWENGYIESFNDKLRDECLNREIFRNGKEAQAIVENWRQEYNNYRPHSSLGYLTPAEFARRYYGNNQAEAIQLTEKAGSLSF